MPKFNALYAEILLADNAKVGSAVFNGRYMFSQSGMGYDPNTQVDIYSEDYHKFMKCSDGSDYSASYGPYYQYSAFKPTMCLDFLNGQSWFDNGGVYFGGGEGNTQFMLYNNGIPFTVMSKDVFKVLTDTSVGLSITPTGGSLANNSIT